MRTTDESSSTRGAAPGRWERATAVAVDLAWAFALLFAATLAAFLWLFVRTDRGAQPVADGESLIATALIGAAIPAWFAWLAVRIQFDAATRGQRRTGLRVEVVADGRPAPRLLRLAVHPLAIPAWLWIGGFFALLEVPALPGIVVVIAVTIAAMTVIDIAIVLANPGAAALHDRIAGTRLVRAEARRP